VTDVLESTIVVGGSAVVADTVAWSTGVTERVFGFDDLSLPLALTSLRLPTLALILVKLSPSSFRNCRCFEAMSEWDEPQCKLEFTLGLSSMGKTISDESCPRDGIQLFYVKGCRVERRRLVGAIFIPDWRR
jgi:hypothetical protein